jgi:ribonuclease Z
LLEIKNTRVFHCPQSYGVAITFESGIKLVYSGDTRPTKRLVDIGKDATILIHEATFDDGKSEEAVAKKHSTVSEALDIAKSMNACRVILTHFSQRYPTMPPTNADREVYPAVYAFDFMSVTYRDLLWAPQVHLNAHLHFHV